MFFSILVPVYNTSLYLRECIDSVLNQNFQDYELVLIDDGSTDGSGSICDEYQAKYPSIIRVIHKQNEGLMMTRRRGFQEAEGQYFICLDSDDYLYDAHALEKIHQLIMDTGCDLVLYDYIHGEKERSQDRRVQLFEYSSGHVFSDKEELYITMMSSNKMNNIWLKCPKRDIVDIDLDYSRWKASICRAEDIFQSIPMVTNAQKVAYLNEPLYYYRWAQNSISNNYKLKYYNAYCTIYQREARYTKKWKLPEKYRDCAEKNYLIATCKLVSLCYSSCKAKGKLREWKKFIRRLSRDKIYLKAGKKCNMNTISRFYRMIYSSIVHKNYIMTELIVSVIPSLYAILHKG